MPAAKKPAKSVVKREYKYKRDPNRPSGSLPTKASIVKEFADLPPLRKGGTRLLGKREVMAQVNLSFPSIHELLNRGEFPDPVVVLGRPNWREGDIYEWIMSRPVRKYPVGNPVAAHA